MRPDMDRVIVNIGRWGSRFVPSRFKYAKRHDAYGYDEDGRAEYLGNLPEGPASKKGIRAQKLRGSYWDDKTFGDRLNPMRRFLQKNADRPWNDVYSEIRKEINANSVRGNHFMTHLRDGVYFYHRRFSHVGYSWRIYPDWHPVGPYVDKDGILRFQTHKEAWPREKEPPRPRIIQHGKAMFWKHHGTWFEVFGKPYGDQPMPQCDTFGFDIGNQRFKEHALKKHYGIPIVLEGKRTLSKKEIKFFGLNHSAE